MNVITFTIIAIIGPQKYAFVRVRLALLYRMTTPCKGDESPEGSRLGITITRYLFGGLS